ncbi:MAG: hypothetical protein AAGF11_13175 [Myxococcota bacterium]
MVPELQRIPRRSPYLSFATLLLIGVEACQTDGGRVVTNIDDRAMVTFERPLCRGNIAQIEETMAHVEDNLDVQVQSPIEITLWSRYADVADHCWEGALGCYRDGEIHTLWYGLEHEIVHAVAGPLGRPEPLWIEGIAEALSGRTHDGEVDVGSLVGLEDGRDVEYSTAGHFTRWLLEEYGVEGIRDLARESSFEDTYGMELGDAGADYETNAPWSYPHWNPCRGERLDPTLEGEWVHDIVVDCDDPWSSAEYESGPTVLRTIDIEDPGTYRLFVTGVRMVGAIACQLETLVEPPAADVAGSIVQESSGAVLPTFFLSDQAYEIPLEQGRVQWGFTVEGEAETVEFELRRIGP